jgi:predicted DNA-binding transcriptional regulator YafY
METRWHLTQTATTSADGSVVLTFEIDGLEEISHWLLGWTGQFQVLQPEELRRTVAERLENGLRLNRSSASRRSDPPESEA